MQISLSQFNAFIFDFDGVILDSLDVKTRAFGELFKDRGRDIREKVMNYHRNNGGVSRYEKFKYFYKNFFNEEITPEIIDDLDKKYSALVVEEVVKAPFVEGAEEFLKEIHSRQRPCFVISGTPQEEMRRIVKLRGLDHFFKDVFGSPTNKTENLSQLLKKYGVKANEAIFFGDAKADYEAARQNGVQFIGIVDKSSELDSITNVTKIKNFKNVFSLEELPSF